MSLVLATFNRQQSVVRLLQQLAQQSLPADAFEVVLVDDGSQPPVAGALEGLRLPYSFRLIRQENAGAAAARHRGVLESTAEVLVITDDDMELPAEFLAAHLCRHPAGTRRFVIGRIRSAPGLGAMPLFERFHAGLLERWNERRLHGNALCTGNVSLRRSDYDAVGGFDLSLPRAEDMELGLRLEQAGVEPTYSEEAFTVHHSDHTRFAVWRGRAFLYGRCDLRVARKHPRLAFADPWRFFFGNALAKRPFVSVALAVPALGRVVAEVVLFSALVADRVGLERLAVLGTSLLWDLEYFSGVRAEAGGFTGMIRSCLEFLEKAETASEPLSGLGWASSAAKRALRVIVPHPASR